MTEIVRHQERRFKKTGLLSFLVSLILVASLPSAAQLSTASVAGVVRDPSGSIIPNANILLRNLDTSVENTTVTNSAGAYALVSITPGRYTLKAAAVGFGPKEVPAFTLAVSQIATIDFSLAVGSQNVVVKVQGATTQLDTSSSNLGTVIGTRQVNDLPLNGRNFTQLLLLTPGASPVNYSQNGGGVNTNISEGASFSFPALNGQTNRSNVFLLDGLNNQETIFSTYAVAPILDAIQEFKVVSHTDSAEFGSVTGGVINVVTKSGTNNLHGSLWSYYRDQILDARSYFVPVTTEKTPYHQNQFGGAIGGPVVIPKLYNGKDRSFFFGAYQGFRFIRTADSPLHVPTAAQLSGDESDWPTQIYNPFSTIPDPANPGQYIRQPLKGNQIPATMIDPRMVAFAKFLFPAAGPIIDNAGDNALDTTPNTQTQDEWNIRVDQKIGANDSAFFRYSFVNSLNISSGGLPSVQARAPANGRDWGGSYTHVFNSSLVLQAQYAKTTVLYNNQRLVIPSTTAIFAQVGFSPQFAGNFTAPGAPNGGNLLPAPGIAGLSGPDAGDNIMDQPKTTDSSQFYGSLTKVLGNHTLHFGGGYITTGFTSPISYATLTFSAQQTGDTNPADTVNAGDPMASFLLNVPDGAVRTNSNEMERPGGVLSAFGQDTWRATPHLTLNFGLRYDITFIPPYGTDAELGQQGGPETGDMDFSNGTYIVQKVPGACSVLGKAPCIPGGVLPPHVIASPNGKIAHNTYTNLGPRFGFSFQADSNTVIRGGFGIVYDNWAAVNQIAQNIAGAWPDIGQQLATNLNVPNTASATPTVQAQNPFGNSTFLPAATPFNQFAYFYDPHMQNPYAEQWNLGVQRLLSQSTTLTVDYVGAGSHRLDEGYVYNTALTPGPGDVQPRALYPYIAVTPYDRSFGNVGSYNALQVSLTRRSTSFGYQVSYTWSKIMDDGTDGWFGAEGTNATDPYDPAAFGNHSVASYNLKNILAVNTVYAIPLGRGTNLSTGHKLLDYALGGWQVNGLFQAHSGLPFTPYISSDIANTGNSGTYEHLNLIGDPNKLRKRTDAEWFNTSAYATPPGYTYGTAARNSLIGPAFWDLDGSLFRSLPVSESRQFQFRAEAFNLLNNVNLGQPANDINTGQQFGTINGTANNAREIQLVLKFLF
jgi:Carboxypeptidase regulatory-like domain